MNKKKNEVYKGIGLSNEQQPHKETIRATEILYNRIADMLRMEDDFTCEPLKPIGRFFGQYVKRKKFENGWIVQKIVMPDSSTQQGDGYQSIAIVATTAKTEEGISEARRRAAEVKTKIEKTGATTTNETVIILSGNLDFNTAKLSRQTRGNQKVYVFSVKNALGVVKVILKKFANLFSIRAKKILGLGGLEEGALKKLAYLFLKRAEKLSKDILQLEKALVERKKGTNKGINKLIGISFGLVNKAKKWGLKFGKGKGKLWVYDDDLLDPAYLRDKINLIAEMQGIDLFGIEAETRLREVGNAKPIR